MKRKVIKQGNDTLTVTLPRGWTRRYGIAGGDSLNMEVKNQILEFSHQQITRDEAFQLEIGPKNPTRVKWLLGALFRIGIDEMTVSYDDESVLDIIQKVLSQNLTGLIITEQRKSSCVIKSISTDEQANLSSLMNRSYLIICSLVDNIIELMESGEHSRFADLLYLHDNCDQTISLCQRIIAKNFYNDVVFSAYTIALLENMELLGDAWKDICNLGMRLKKPDRVFMEPLRETQSIQNEMKASLFEMSRPDDRLHARITKARKNFEKLYEKSDKYEMLILYKLHHILTLVKNFFPTLMVLNLHKSR